MSPCWKGTPALEANPRADTIPESGTATTASHSTGEHSARISPNLCQRHLSQLPSPTRAHLPPYLNRDWYTLRPKTRDVGSAK
jgi:hypothetical protein